MEISKCLVLVYRVLYLRWVKYITLFNNLSLVNVKKLHSTLFCLSEMHISSQPAPIKNHIFTIQ